MRRHSVNVVTAHLLTILLAVQGATAQNKPSCIYVPPEKSTAEVLSAPPDYRVVDLRLMTRSERSAALAKTKPTDLLMLNEQLLKSSAAVAEIQRSRAAFAVLDHSGAHAQQTLRTQIHGLEVFAEVPTTNQEVTNMYGKGKAAPACFLARMRKIRPIARTNGHIATAILSEAHKTSDALLVILAHNDGTYLRFPDGSQITPATLSDALASSGRPGVILSCDTISANTAPVVSTTKRIDFEAAAHALQEIRTATERNAAGLAITESRTYGDFLNDFAKRYRDPRARIQRTLMIVVTGVGIAVILAILCTDKDDCGFDALLAQT